MKKIDRTGEEGHNNFGSKMIISKYNNSKDIDVYLPEYNCYVKNVMYKDFKKGNIKCPYEKRTYGIGYIGEGKYKSMENGKLSKCYITWKSMLERCYYKKLNRNPTYKDVIVCDEWHNFQNFAEWYYNNYYEIPNKVMCLDKDILFKGNKVYSPETCVFVSQEINTLFIKRDKVRGSLCIGVTYDKRYGKYQSQCSMGDKRINLGYYKTEIEAFQVYKEYKENYIKEVADEYKEYIPQKLYEAMYNYEVEIDD